VPAPLRLPTPESPYVEFEPSFERALVAASCSFPRFWASIGKWLAPGSIRDPRGQTLLRACHRIARVSGDGPDSSTVVLQALISQVADGKMTQQEVDGAAQLLTDVLDIDGGIPALPSLVAEAAPVLQRRASEALLAKMSEAQGRGEALGRYAEDLAVISTIGEEGSTGSVVLGSSVWSAIADLRRTDLLPLGLAPLDEAIKGGLPPRTLTVIGADMNVGKTAMLVHVACYAFLLGKRVIFASTEEGVTETLARCIAWITGVSMERVYRSDPEAQRKLKTTLNQSGVGAIAMEYLPQGSHCSHLNAMVEKVLADHPRFEGGYDLLVVDYADKMDGPGDNTYDRYRSVYNGLRQIAVDARVRVLTASQIKDLENKRTPGAGDLSDSRWKGRTADTVITMWKDEDGDAEERYFHVAKHRGPGVGTVVGPVLTDLAHARMGPLPSALLEDDDLDL